MLNESNAHEITQIAEEVGALAFRGQLQYPGPVHSALLRDADAKTGDWELAAWQLSVAVGRLSEGIPEERDQVLALVEASS